MTIPPLSRSRSMADAGIVGTVGGSGARACGAFETSSWQLMRFFAPVVVVVFCFNRLTNRLKNLNFIIKFFEVKEIDFDSNDFTEHSRHIHDLKKYYEQEIDELRNDLQKTQNKFE